MSHFAKAVAMHGAVWPNAETMRRSFSTKRNMNCCEHTLARGKAVSKVSLAPYAYLRVSRIRNEHEYITRQ